MPCMKGNSRLMAHGHMYVFKNFRKKTELPRSKYTVNIEETVTIKLDRSLNKLDIRNIHF